jgi:hypothetical protein
MIIYVYIYVRLNSPEHWHMKTKSKSLKILHVVTHEAGAYALGEGLQAFLFLRREEVET